MADEDDFKIKGAAKTSTSPPEFAADHDSQSDRAASECSEAAEEAEEGELLGEDKPPSEDELKAKYRWFKCEADPFTYGPDQCYYVHGDTHASSWTEPDEPYWIYDQAAGSADLASGLQFPKQSKSASDEGVGGSTVDEPYTGYNPKIHGNYDPNADYAQYHKRKRAEEAAAAAKPYGFGRAAGQGAAAYESTMALNRFTGHTQAADLGPDRHSDAAKSARQMNAFFDVDAAANIHEGRSLKEERKNQKLSKEQIKAFNQARHEKKQKKRMAFYKS